jgi:selenocysteine lyase/cysteine desulfurase
MRRLGVAGTVRASLQVYNARREIDALAEALAAARAEVSR